MDSRNMCFEIGSQISNFFTGENLVWSTDGQYFYCQNQNQISVVSLTSGKSIDTIDFADSDSLISFDIAHNNQLLVTAHKSGLIKLWEIAKKKLIKEWKSTHSGLITNLLFGTCSSIICSVGSDSKICVWNSEKRYCVSQFEGKGRISVICFYPQESKPLIYAAGDDYIINCWNYLTKIRVNSLIGHLSKVTAISFEDRNLQLMSSVSADKVLILWQLSTNSQLKVIPLYEPLIGVFFSYANFSFLSDIGTSDKRDFVITASSTGNINLINCADNKVMYSLRIESSLKQKNSDLRVKNLLHCKKLNYFAILTADYRILVYDMLTFDLLKQLIGYNDEILDMCLLGEKCQFLSIATNSNSIKIYDTIEANCIVATEHTNTILALSGFGNLLLSAGKDHKICIWKLNPELFLVECIQQCMGHTSPIGSISLLQNFLKFASVSQDGCLKLWFSSQIKNDILPQKDVPIFKLKNSIKAHDKEINCITFSPNNNLLATASQDKNIKIWDNRNLDLLGTLRGHRRGVWTVRFSPVDQILLSTSSDCTIRLWSLSTLTCFKIMENLCSMLRVEFILNGKQFISTAVDGTIKIWNLASFLCVSTLDNHSDRVWALAVPYEETCFYSGGADSKVICWKDVTEKKITEKEATKQMLSKTKEMLCFSIKENFIKKSIYLALSLNQPFISYKVICGVIKKRNIDVLKQSLLSDDGSNLLKNIKAWNTNRRHCIASQIALFCIMNKVILRQSDFFNSEGLLQEINCYTKRHYKRTSMYLKELCFLDFAIKCM